MEDLGKLIVAKGFKKLPKVQNITQSGHTGCHKNSHKLDAFSWKHRNIEREKGLAEKVAAAANLGCLTKWLEFVLF